MTSFITIRERVFASLPKCKQIELQSQVAKRISANPLKFLDGTVSEKEKYLVFKHSLISIFTKREQDKEYSLLLHLIKVLFDSFESKTSKELRSVGGDENTPSDNVKVIPTKSKNKIAKVKVSANDKKSDIIQHISKPSAIENSEVSMNIEVSTSKLDVPITSGTCMELDQTVTNGLQTTSQAKKSRSKRGKKRVGSAIPGTPENIAACKQQMLDPRNADIEVTSSEVWDNMWRRGASAISLHFVDIMLSSSPAILGVNCSRNHIGDCYYCIQTLLTYPLTDCSSVGCKSEEHLHGVFMHPNIEYSLQEFHAEKLDVNLMDKLILSRSLLPNVIYIMLHDRTDTKTFKDKNKVSSSLRKSVEHYLDIFKSTKK